MYQFRHPGARELIGHVLDTHPEGPSLQAEAGHRRSLAQRSAAVAAEALATMKAAQLGYEALRRRLDPRHQRTLHFGVGLLLLVLIAAALLALDHIELAGILSRWMAAAAAAADAAAWAGCAWLAALALRDERRGMLVAIAAGAAAAELLLAALHGWEAPVGRAPGRHQLAISVLAVLLIFALVTIAMEVITRTEPAAVLLARRRWHRSRQDHAAAVRIQRSDAEAAAVAEQEWCTLIDAHATAYSGSAPQDGRYAPEPWPGEPPM